MQIYSANYLLPDEQVVKKLKVNKRAILGPLTPLLIVLTIMLVGIILAVFLTQTPPTVLPYGTDSSPIGIIAMSILLMLGPIIHILILLKKRKNYLNSLSVSLTNKRIVGKVKSLMVSIPLEEIVGSNINRKLFGKIFKYDTLTIATAQKTFKFCCVSDTEEFVKTPYTCIEENQKENL